RIAKDKGLAVDQEPFRLNNGRFVAITKKFGLVLFNRDMGQQLEMINIVYWGGHTSPIVGLFLSEVEARACLTETDLKEWDRRWIVQSSSVLEEIGWSHSRFTVSRELMLLEA